ncbi:zinc finger protein 277 [Elysia marginata]|uniref:Zinc finger protein 277 n=1 Tax=Elysia marginata TaxID=1093978 RepID=A0AAV4JVX5_9GAST|nr:zinc finger protein 277 [Elysia marginata]
MPKDLGKVIMKENKTKDTVQNKKGEEGQESTENMSEVQSKSEGVSQCRSQLTQEESKNVEQNKDTPDLCCITQAVDVNSSSKNALSSSSVDSSSSSVDYDEHLHCHEIESVGKESQHYKDDKEKDQPLVLDGVSSLDSLSLDSSDTATNDSEKESSNKFGSPASSENILESETEKSDIPKTDEKEVSAIQNATESFTESIDVNTEPIREALKEILRVSPGKTAVDCFGEEKQKVDKSSPCSAGSLKNEIKAEGNLTALQSIAFDDPAIVTSSDVCANSSPRPTVPCEGDGSSHIMNLLRKSLQNDLANKGDGDKVFDNSSPEKPKEKVSVGRTRTDSSTSTSTASAETGLTEERREEKPVREMLVRRQASQTNMPASDKPVLETLTFGTSLDDGDGIMDNEEDANPKKVADSTCPCPLCDRSFPANKKEDVLAHLVLVHKFVIADVNFIGNLSVYLRYWKERLKTRPIHEFCSKIITNTGVKDEAEKEEFYLLCDALPEDKDIREQLQRKKLEQVLAQQQREREETKFCRQCLFCKQTFCGNRSVLFDHLLRDHMFHMGQPDNLVFTDELFDLIQFKLDSQLCLYCEKSFKDKPSLREHMRKKQHRRINPKNKEYDRFYIINYMEMGKNWESLQQEDARLIKNKDESDEEDEWADWNDECQHKVVCLFCDSACSDQQDLHKHMKENHAFDLQDVNQKLQLNFYQKVKLINFIRRQVYHKTCYGCQECFPDKPQLTAHMTKDTDHINKLPEASIWDQSQYFFPTYEDDNLLCHLEDDDDEGAAGDALGVMVYAEDIPVSDNTILRDQKLHRELLRA